MNTTFQTALRATLLTLAIGGIVLAPSAQADSVTGDYTETIEREIPFDSGGSLSVTNRNGDIKVSVWDEDAIKLVAEKTMKVERAYSWFARLIGLKEPKIESEEDAKAYLEKFKVEVAGERDDLRINTVYPAEATNLRFHVHYRITVPRHAEVNIQTRNGTLTVTGVTGSVEAETTNGSVRLSDITGPAQARSTNGTIELDNIAGGIEARTVNGRIDAKLATAPGPKDEIVCRTTNGRIRLVMPAGANFDLLMRSSSGSLSTDFELASVVEDTKKRLEGTVGEGGPLVSLRTVNGRVALEAR